MKFLLNLSIVLFCLSSLACNYNFESIPDKRVSFYEVALPLANDTFVLNNYINFPGATFPAGFSHTIEESYPFFLGDLNWEDNSLEWMEPRMLVTNNIPSSVLLSFSCFALVDGILVPFWIEENTEIKTGTSIIEARIDKESMNEVKTAKDLILRFTIRTKEDVNATDLLRSFFRIRLGAKAGFLMNQTAN